MEKRTKPSKRWSRWRIWENLLDGRWGRSFSLLLISLFILAGVLGLALLWPRLGLPSGREQVATSAPEESDPARNYAAGIRSSERQDYPQALVFFQRAVERDPANVAYLEELALVEYQLKDYDAARKDYGRLLELDGAGASSYRNRLANLDWLQGDREAAESLFRQAIAQDPSFSLSYNNLALLLSEEGKQEQAVAVLEEGIKKSADGAGLHETLLTLQGDGHKLIKVP